MKRFSESTNLQAEATTAPIITELISCYGSRPGTQGLYLSGSMATNSASPGSDIDFYVVSERLKLTDERRTGNRLIEIRIRPMDWYEKRLRKAGPIIYQLLEARVLWDPDGVIEGYRRIAQAKYDAFRGSAERRKNLKYLAGEAVFKIRGALKYRKYERAGFLAGAHLTTLLEAIFAANRKPFPSISSAHKWVGTMPHLPDNFETLFWSACAGDTVERSGAMAHLLEKVARML